MNECFLCMNLCKKNLSIKTIDGICIHKWTYPPGPLKLSILPNTQVEYLVKYATWVNQVDKSQVNYLSN